MLGRDRPAAEYAFLRVADTGPGMDPETQERVFEPYFSTIGRGTVFTVYFPLAEAAGQVPVRGSSPCEAPRS